MQMVATRVFETGRKPLNTQVREGATLAEVLDAVGTALSSKSTLSQNGRRASLNDRVKPNSIVQLMPQADHG